MVILETDRLRLRTLELTDIDAVMGFWGDPEVMRYCGGPGSREQELRSIRFYRQMHQERGFSPYLIELKETGDPVGVCGFNPPSDGHDAELMYHLAKSHWGKGYATEAAEACLEYAKETLGFRSVIASADPRNAASQKILTNIGFESIGMKWYEDTGQEEPCYVMKFSPEGQ